MINLKETKAITLVALVITIIILLILAGVTIATLNKWNILNNSELVAEKSKVAQYKEEITIDIQDWKIDQYNGSEKISLEEYLRKKENYSEIQKLEDDTIKGIYKGLEFEIGLNNNVTINNDNTQDVINYYKVTLALSEGISIDNSSVEIEQNKSYIAKIIVEEGYILDALTVTMGEQQITVDKTTGVINIEKVIGNIQINATSKLVDNTSKLLLDGETIESINNDEISSTNIGISENGKFGNCYDFTQANAYINLGNASKYLGEGEQFTIDMWINATQIPSGCSCIINLGGSNVSGGFTFGVRSTNNGPYLYMSKHIYTNTEKTIELNKWHHIALVRNNEIYTTYIDGKLATQANANYNYTKTLTLGIGHNKSWSSERFIGYIDNIRITDTARWTENFNI